LKAVKQMRIYSSASDREEAEKIVDRLKREYFEEEQP
jgi:hypothetical protein